MNEILDKRSPFRTRFDRSADGLLAATVVVLPWSVSITIILVGCWLIAALISLSPREIGSQIATPAGGLPVALCLLMLAGTLWAGVDWAERAGGVDAYLKLLLIPVLLAQFRRSGHGVRILNSYLVSCGALMALSYAFMISPQIAFLSTLDFGVPVKSAVAQSGAFTICMFVALYLAVEHFREGRRGWAATMFGLAVLFLVNVVCVLLSLHGWFMVPRVALLVIPVLLVVFVQREFGIRATLGSIAAVIVLVAITLAVLPTLHTQAAEFWHVMTTDRNAWLGEDRPIMWRRSLDFIQTAPILGHGSGSIRDLFHQAAAGQPGVAGRLTANPHQQTFAIGIQLGLVGIALLWAMWLSHLLLFRGYGLAAWVGFVAVSQNILTSIFDSHLADFTESWTYVLFVGAAGGMVLQRRNRDRARDSVGRPLQQSPGS